MRTVLLTTILAFSLSFFSGRVADALLSKRIPIVGQVVGLELVHNPGIAFGMRLPPVLQEILIAVALCCIAYAAWHYRHSRLSSTGFGLVIGGGLANILDRLGDKAVTDFLQIGTFPVFNSADSCITVGVALLVAESFFTHRRHVPPQSPSCLDTFTGPPPPQATVQSCHANRDIRANPRAADR